MKPIYDAWLIQIEITNACIKKCAHCTRAVPHIKEPYFAELSFVEKALQSLHGWKRGVGCMGGEPTLHPRFPEICELYKRYFPKKQCGIFTSGGPKYDRYRELIDTTFGIIHYHNHETPSYHQPIMVASEEIVSDEKLRKKLIEDCWLQRTWSPSISKKGCFFCEVAGTFDLLFNGPGGYPIEPDWWKKRRIDFEEQVQRYCKLCSVAIPMENFPDSISYDYVSKGNAERLALANSPLYTKDQIKIYDQEITKNRIQEIKLEQEISNPGHYAKSDGINYFRKSPFMAKIWAKNIKHECLRFLKSGRLFDLINILKPINFPELKLSTRKNRIKSSK